MLKRKKRKCSWIYWKPKLFPGPDVPRPNFQQGKRGGQGFSDAASRSYHGRCSERLWFLVQSFDKHHLPSHLVRVEYKFTDTQLRNHLALMWKVDPTTGDKCWVLLYLDKEISQSKPKKTDNPDRRRRGGYPKPKTRESSVLEQQLANTVSVGMPVPRDCDPNML